MALMPWWLFSPSLNSMDRHGFVDDELESANVNAFELVRHGSQCVVELLMFCSFESSNLCIDSMLANIDERRILGASEVEGVSKGC